MYKFKLKEKKYGPKGFKVGDTKTIKGKKSTITSIDPDTGGITWDLEDVAAFDTVYKNFDELRQLLKTLEKTGEAKDDSTLDKISDAVGLLFNQFRTHIRKNYPDQYKRVLRLKEGTFHGPREIAIYDGPDGETYIEKRGTGYYGYNNEFDFTAEDKAELKHKLNSWGYRLVAGSIDESVNENEAAFEHNKARAARIMNDLFGSDFQFDYTYKLDGDRVVIHPEGYNNDGTLFDMKDVHKKQIIKTFQSKLPGASAKPNMGGGITVHLKESLNEQPEQWTQLDVININKSLRLTLKTFNNLINNIKKLETELSKHQYKPQGDLLQKMMPDSFDYVKVQDKLHKLYNAFSNAFGDALNEDLTIGGKKVKTIHKNNSNNPEDHTIEYEDGSTEPYLDHLKEEEIDEGEGIGYLTPDAFDKNKKSTGAPDIYYYKLGYKPVPKKIKGAGTIVKQLFEKEELTEYSDFQQKRINAFDELEEKFNQISPLLSNAKSETAKFYNENPGSYAIAYSTDMIDSYVDNIIELLKQEE